MDPRHGPSVPASKSLALVAGRPSALKVAGSKSLRAMRLSSVAAPRRAAGLVLVRRLVRNGRQFDRGGEGLDLADPGAREGVHHRDDEGIGLDLRPFLGPFATVDLDHGLAAALAIGGDQPGAA